MNHHKCTNFWKASDMLESIAISSSEYAIIATDSDSNIILWNKGAQIIYGYTPKEMLGKKIPSSLNKDPFHEDFLLASVGIQSDKTDHRGHAIKKDGSSIPVSITITPRTNNHNEVVGNLIMVRDISKSIHNEQLKNLLFEIAHIVNSSSSVSEMCTSVCNTMSVFLEIPTVFICLFDYLNDTFSINSQTGLNKNYPSHTCKYLCEDIDVSSDVKGCFDTYTQLTINKDLLNDHQISSFVEKKVTAPDEQFIVHIPLTLDVSLIGIIHIIISSTQIESYPFETQVLSLIANEITAGIQRRRLLTEIKGYADNLEKMVEDRTRQLREKDAQLVQWGKLATLGEMATGIAHEINQPLGSISLNTQGLLMAKSKDKLSDSVLLEKLNTINEQVERIDKIIGHLRTFSRQSDHTKKEIEIIKPIMDVFKIIGEQLSKSKISVDIQTEENLPLIIADHNKLEQVFLNIIGNAKDSILELESIMKKNLSTNEFQNWLDTALKKITISVKRIDQNLVIEISDTGTGIKESIINKIFDPFFTTKDVGKGTGIGLYISYGIIKEFNGTISVQSVEMKGTIFTISFPLVKTVLL